MHSAVLLDIIKLMAKNGTAPNGMTYDAMRKAVTDEGRHCTLCGEFKPWSDYPKNKRGFRGHNGQCKKCWSSYVAEWNQLDHAKAARKRQIVRRTYGPDGLAAHDRLLAGAGCDVCGRRTRRMAIDHCHDTERVRGLLCKDCNLILGWVNDDPVRLRALADYVERSMPSMKCSSSSVPTNHSPATLR